MRRSAVQIGPSYQWSVSRPKGKGPLTGPFDSDRLIPGRNHALRRLVRRPADSTKLGTLTALGIDVVFPKAE